jgi:hypothetical protein
MLAPVAHAEEKTPTFTAGEGLSRETGSQVEQQQFTLAAGTVKCNEANLVDKAAIAGMMLIMEPSYSGCTLGGSSATVTMNGCKYTFEPTSTTEEDRYMGRMGIICPLNGSIKISNAACTVTIEEQLNLEAVEFENNTAAEPKKDETWTTNIKSLVYMQTGTCSGGTGIFGGGGMMGSETVKGESEFGEPVDLWIGD